MKKENLLPTAIALVLGLAGVLLLLFAWHLPPFAPAAPVTENAYLRGKVTQIAPQVSGYVAAVEVRDFQVVHAGDVIARIDDRIPRQKLAQAEAQLQAARAALDEDVRITATDLNPPMLDLARSKRGHLAGVEFRDADAQELPYLDAYFDTLFCQFGWMFLPDKALGFRAARLRESDNPGRS